MQRDTAIPLLAAADDCYQASRNTCSSSNIQQKARYILRYGAIYLYIYGYISVCCIVNAIPFTRSSDAAIHVPDNASQAECDRHLVWRWRLAKYRGPDSKGLYSPDTRVLLEVVETRGKKHVAISADGQFIIW